jgi:hypothetical protein
VAEVYPKPVALNEQEVEEVGEEEEEEGRRSKDRFVNFTVEQRKAPEFQHFPMFRLK